MPAMNVHVKHAGKLYDIQLDPDLPPAVFKEAVYQATGVPPDRMKVMVKGGVLKDDSSWKKIGPKEGQTFTVIGAVGELPKPPEKPIVFLEDMDESELAEVLAKPVGLANLGNTCYMNSTIQAFRAIPELQVALSVPSLQSATPLPASLRDLYKQMLQTTDSIQPFKFLQVLREVNPQFAEMDRSEKSAANPFLAGRMYAQQDAEECYSTIVNSLRNIPGLDNTGSVVNDAEGASQKHFIDQYLMGEMNRELRCDEAPEEPPVASSEKILKIECNINNNTNFMLTGIMNSLDQKVEKNSPSLGRQAVYSQKSRVSRLPTYLTVHMVRFAWRSDIGKKTKIMRKVRFPVELDALDLATDDLRSKLLPASRKLKEIEKERAERRKVRTKTKQGAGPPVPVVTSAPSGSGATTDVEMAEVSSTQVATTSNTTGGENSEAKDKAKDVSGENQEDELTVREKEAEDFSKLVDESVKADIGASSTGLYDLVAIVTHKGAAADGGHYMGFVKRNTFSLAKLQEKSKDKVVNISPSPAVVLNVHVAGEKTTVKELDEVEGDEDWFKFDDDKVSVFPREKLMTLDGGGEDSSAYVLLYKSKTA